MKNSRIRRGRVLLARAAGAHRDSGTDTAASRPTRTPAAASEYAESRHRVANQPKTTYACSDWRPKKKIIDSPIGVRRTSKKPTECGLCSTDWSWATIGSHGIAATR